MDIRELVDGLRPMADFKTNVERTIEALKTDRTDREETEDLIDFWSMVASHLPA